MSISIDQWRASISLIYGQAYGHIRIKLSKDCSSLKVVTILLCFFAAFAFLLLLKHDNDETNPGAKIKKQDFCLVFTGIKIAY